ncbi:MAG: hypothetical protein ACR2NM_06810 [Bythopirellula sp.]
MALEVAAGAGFAAKQQAQDEASTQHEDQRPPELATRDAQLATCQEATAGDATTTFPEVRQPLARDHDEARQLLRLAQLEGRDPLQDAVAGRLALDRLDAVADRDADPQRAGWADELRRELRERFNDIAPTKLEVT